MSKKAKRNTPPSELSIFVHALGDFITDPTRPNFFALQRAKTSVGDQGLCHPFAQSVPDDGVQCTDGLPCDDRYYESSMVKSPPCPMMLESGRECLLREARPSLTDVHLRAILVMAELKARYPDWSFWKKHKL